MKKMIIWSVLCLLPMQMSAQVNPKEGYVITNEGDTVRGTINYLKDEENAKACQFRKAGEVRTKSCHRRTSADTGWPTRAFTTSAGC